MSVDTTNLEVQLRTALSRYPAAGRLWLGFSGGLDSTVLLHLLASQGVPFTALHVHHGLSANADEWLDHCEREAARLSVPFVAQQVQVNGDTGGIEQGAREARYRVFNEYMVAGDQLLLAHHGDDQVETFLLRLLRGAGVLGLAAMGVHRRMAEDRSVLRPLLEATRADLENYAHHHHLSWIEDESNNDLSFERNYLRRSVTPALAARWPVAGRVARATENLREAADLLAEMAVGDLAHCDHRSERFGESIDLSAMRALSPARQRNLLRYWFGLHGDSMPQASHLNQVLEQMEAAADACPTIEIASKVIRRYRDRLYLTPQLPSGDGRHGEQVWRWDGVGRLQLPGGWALLAGDGWPPGDYRVQFRRGGERAHPVARPHSQSLKKLLQEYVLEPWLRDSVPLVYRDGTLLAVGDLFVTAGGPPAPPLWRFSD